MYAALVYLNVFQLGTKHLQEIGEFIDTADTNRDNWIDYGEYLEMLMAPLTEEKELSNQITDSTDAEWKVFKQLQYNFDVRSLF